MTPRVLSEQAISLHEEVAERRAILREMVNQDLADLCRGSVRRVLEELMRHERDWVLGYGYRERRQRGQRPDHRNGCYQRDVVTTFGVIPQVAVPRRRRGSYQTAILPRYQRRLGQVDQAIRECPPAGWGRSPRSYSGRRSQPRR